MAHLCPGELPQLADLANSGTARRHSWADLGGMSRGRAVVHHHICIAHHLALLSLSNLVLKLLFMPTDQQNRPEWSNKLEFLMSCISMSVGLGNVWRFPFTAYENGGGAFLIPYIIVLFVIGRPLYYLEMILGQFTSRSSVKIWEISPLFRGIGVGQLVGTTSVVTYYVSLIAITLSYMFASFASELPWAKCEESWGEHCVDSSAIIAHAGNRNKTDEQAVSSSQIYFL
ncbi:sodium/Chloride dependent amino acid transporter [Culex quinquefasciatus]|uniref:Transporter n=1 Tax=Culex quinquefasciatus TaxID=7176 RepID=B0W8F9_CULQU|nr:sodium/Chloride dependent amino acid transporter [Culex quinquefasciatus]|eukprot:XP_001844993.1 sodium/Chloride dependent amino acid transporter [Culex quinquefasciatus]